MRTFDIASLNVLIPTYDQILAQMQNTRFKDMTLEERCKMFEDSYASTFYETGSTSSNFKKLSRRASLYDFLARRCSQYLRNWRFESIDKVA